MKNKILIAITVSSLFSCKKYLSDVSDSPNLPSKVGIQNQLSAAEVATISNYTGQLARNVSMLMQTVDGIQNQSTPISQYQIFEGDVINEWSTIYSNALVNTHDLTARVSDKENPYILGIAQILEAYNLGLATDLWGDVPYSDAFKGADGNFKPKYDSQADLYNSIQSLLDKAIINMSKPASANKILPLSDDIFYNCSDTVSAKNWVNVAWGLKARYANRLSKINPAASATQVLNYLSNIDINSFKNFEAKFGTINSNANQWWAFQSQRAYIQCGEYFIDTLFASNDPRLEFYADSLADGSYKGSAPGSEPDPNTISPYGSYLSQINKSLPLLTSFELRFIEAEAHLRSGNPSAAAIACNDGIKKSILYVVGSASPTYEAIYANFNSAITLANIMTQKYIAMYSQIESWSDWRRTDFPKFKKTYKGLAVPRRLPTPLTERVNNSNATVVSNIYDRVYFDKQ